MSDFSSCRNGVVARKTHKCCLCGERISVGDIYDIRSGRNCGDFFCMKMHSECRAYEVNTDAVEQDWYEDVSGPAFDRKDAVEWSKMKHDGVPDEPQKDK